jgi:hypothetical protein
MTPLAVILLVHGITGSYALAGAAAGCVGLLDAAVSPMQARLVDRFGSVPVLVPSVIVSGSSLALLGVEARSKLALLAFAALAGATAPPISGRTKVAWAAIAGADNLPGAYALESLLQQLSFLFGPLLTAGVVAITSPGAAVTTAAGLAAGGALGFVLASPTGPARRASRHALGALASGALRLIVGTTFMQNVFFGISSVAVASFARDHARPLLAGPLLAATNVGAVVGAVAFAGRVTPGRETRRYLSLSGVYAALIFPLAMTSSFVTLGGMLVLLGLTICPIAAVSYLLVARLVPDDVQTEAFTWLSTAVAAGNAVGAAAGGVVTQGLGASGAFLVAAAAAAVAASAAYKHRRVLSRGTTRSARRPRAGRPLGRGVEPRAERLERR